MSRSSSAFETKPEPGSILALLESNDSTTGYIPKIAIILSDDDALFGADFDYNVEAEPLPEINYNAINLLLSICRSCLDKRELKRYDYLAEARVDYYKAHFKFERIYRSLQDANAYGRILTDQMKELKKAGEAKAKEIGYNKAAQSENAKALKALAPSVRNYAQRRNRVTSWFSHMKLAFIRNEIPRLLYVAQHLYEKMKVAGKFLTFSPARLRLLTCWQRSSILIWHPLLV